MSERTPPLDADIEAALTAAQRADEAADAASVKRVRSRLMQRIAADSTPHHVVITSTQGSWHQFLPGIQRKVLAEHDGVMSYLLKFEPGAVLPAHRHPVDEECVVIEGTLKIGNMLLPPGSFHRVPKDVLDCDSTTDEGTLIYLRGATPKAEHLL
jgi:anti-sigma factor ChrR (cupin superfamily)